MHLRTADCCADCKGRFGLIRYTDKFFRGSFCSKACRDSFGFKRKQQIERYRQWMGYLARGSPQT
jgi:hypothetical protein